MFYTSYRYGLGKGALSSPFSSPILPSSASISLSIPLSSFLTKTLTFPSTPFLTSHFSSSSLSPSSYLITPSSSLRAPSHSLSSFSHRRPLSFPSPTRLSLNFSSTPRNIFSPSIEENPPLLHPSYCIDIRPPSLSSSSSSSSPPTFLWFSSMGESLSSPSSASIRSLFSTLQREIPSFRLIALFPQSRYVTSLDDEIPAWFDILEQKFSTKMKHKTDEMEETVDKVIKEFGDIIEYQGNKSDSKSSSSSSSSPSLFLGGFGQGGSLAVYIGLSLLQKGKGKSIKGIISYEGYAPHNEEIRTSISSSTSSSSPHSPSPIPFLTIHSPRDPVIPHSFSLASYTALLKNSPLFKWEHRNVDNGRHDCEQLQLANIFEWINKIQREKK